MLGSGYIKQLPQPLLVLDVPLHVTPLEAYSDQQAYRREVHLYKEACDATVLVSFR